MRDSYPLAETLSAAQAQRVHAHNDEYCIQKDCLSNSNLAVELFNGDNIIIAI